jgi:hypothetical protein
MEIIMRNSVKGAIIESCTAVAIVALRSVAKHAQSYVALVLVPYIVNKMFVYAGDEVEEIPQISGDNSSHYAEDSAA